MALTLFRIFKNFRKQGTAIKNYLFSAYFSWTIANLTRTCKQIASDVLKSVKYADQRFKNLFGCGNTLFAAEIAMWYEKCHILFKYPYVLLQVKEEISLAPSTSYSCFGTFVVYFMTKVR